MKQKLTIIKVSGKIVENPDGLKTFVKEFASIDGLKLLIHSGANLATQVGERMNIKTRTIEDRPIVDEQTLKLLAMVYGGLVNKQIVALLQGRKLNALGITGADLNLVQSTRQGLAGHDLGLTGAVKNINTPTLVKLLEAGVIPVMAPLTHDGNCSLLFNETDALAAEIAKALAPRYDVTLIYCFERNGVLLNIDDEDSVVAVLRRTQYKNLREMDIIKDWFVNKLDNAFSAIDHGVKEVIITNAVNLSRPQLGTHIK